MDLEIWKARVRLELERRRNAVREGEQSVPVTKIQLADAVGYAPQDSRELRKRFMRRICELLRDDGVPICFDGRGCWLPRTAAEVQMTRDYLARNGLAELGAASALKPIQTEAGGQTSMFPDAKPAGPGRHI